MSSIVKTKKVDVEYVQLVCDKCKKDADILYTSQSDVGDLCVDCYSKDYVKTFPKAEVPDLAEPEV